MSASLVVLVTLSGMPPAASAVEQEPQSIDHATAPAARSTADHREPSPDEAPSPETPPAETPASERPAAEQSEESSTPASAEENGTTSAEASAPEGSSSVELADLPDPAELTTLPEHEAGFSDLPLPQPSLGRAVGAAYSCVPGMLYGVNRYGAVFEFNASTGATARTVGQFGGEVVNSPTQAHVFNAVGVSPNGSNLRLMTEVVQSTILGLRMNVSAGSLAPSGSVTNFPHGWQSHDGNVSFVAGGVDPVTGDYIVGTVQRTSANGTATSRFYRVASNGSLAAIGYLQHTFAQQQAQVTMNGDMSFDSNGDMYYMSSVEGRATLWKVPREALSGSGNRLLQAERTADFAIPISFFNGFHMSGNGFAYASSEQNVYQYDMSDWSLTRTFLNVLPQESTDIGGCSYPSAVSVTLQKNLEGERVDPSDQFVLSLSRESDAPTSVTTSGLATGVQPQEVGPITSVSGEAFRIEESMAPGSASSLDSYDSVWQCFDQDFTVVASGTGTSGSFVLPALSLDRQVTCVFTNNPKAAPKLTLVKEFDIRYAAPAEAKAWTLTATAVDGKLPAERASVELSSGETSLLPMAGTYRLSESGPSGYELASVSCLAEGQAEPVELTAPHEIELLPGTSTTCTFLNRDLPGSVAWTKTDNSELPQLLAGSEWTVSIAGRGDMIVEDNSPENPTASGLDEDPAAGRFLITGLPWGTHSIVEARAPSGYVLDNTRHAFVIGGAHLSGAFETGSNVFVNEPEFIPPALTLPFTGARGQFLGLLLLLAGVAAVALVARRITRGKRP